MSDVNNIKNTLRHLMDSFTDYRPRLYDIEGDDLHNYERLVFNSELSSEKHEDMPWSFPYMLNSRSTPGQSDEVDYKKAAEQEFATGITFELRETPIIKIYNSNGKYPSDHLCDIDTDIAQKTTNSHNETLIEGKINNGRNKICLDDNKENIPDHVQPYCKTNVYNTNDRTFDQNNYTVLNNAKCNVYNFKGETVAVKEHLRPDQIYNYLCVCESPECTETAFGNCKPPTPIGGNIGFSDTQLSISNRYLKSDFKINILAIRENRDKRTTCMLKNIPNKYTQSMLKHMLDEHHSDKFDFLYLRMDQKNKCNVGYAFINFINYSEIPSFYEKVNHKGWKKFKSHKIAELTYASIQGLFNLVKKFRRNSFFGESDETRPKIWVKDADVLNLV